MDPQPATPETAPDASPVASPPVASPPADRRPRPMIERIGMALVALVMAGMFGGVAAAAFIGGEPFLGTMGVIGCLMVLWVGAMTLLRG